MFSVPPCWGGGGGGRGGGGGGSLEFQDSWWVINIFSYFHVDPK